MNNEGICNECGELGHLSVVWGKYTNDEGRVKFWRDVMCAACKKVHA